MTETTTPTVEEIQTRADALLRDDIGWCASALMVDDLMKLSGETLTLDETKGLAGAFDIDEIENLYPDPSEWDIEGCKNWLIEHLGETGYDEPEDKEDISDWRDVVNDHAEATEVYEWWPVSSWLCEELREIGEPVIDNNYGYWWGRTCTGQPIMMDGTLQDIAKKILTR
ncbi:hypothetical protein LCGC14_2473960 [marine sediment metagenome]|uniref:Uncharacterized protein n=1 Tax=marine sediment metagenome TaxID=412755 RepID=A0A0F9B9F8_9ZZZZ